MVGFGLCAGFFSISWVVPCMQFVVGVEIPGPSCSRWPSNTSPNLTLFFEFNCWLKISEQICLEEGSAETMAYMMIVN